MMLGKNHDPRANHSSYNFFSFSIVVHGTKHPKETKSENQGGELLESLLHPTHIGYGIKIAYQVSILIPIFSFPSASQMIETQDNDHNSLDFFHILALNSLLVVHEKGKKKG